MANKFKDHVRVKFSGQTTVNNVWKLDWACGQCRRYGNIPVDISGGGIDAATGKPMPGTDDETFLRLLYTAHRGADSGIVIPCTAPLRSLTIGHMWRKERQTGGGYRLIIMERKGGKPVAEYRWPPWLGQEKGYW